MEQTHGREIRPEEYSHAKSAPQSMPASFGPSRSGILDDPLGPVRNVVRRWRLIVLTVTVGALLGWVSAVGAADSAIAPVEVDHYQATHVLVLDSTVPVDQSTLNIRNLNLLAKRATVGEVPQAVADSLDLPLQDAASRIRAVVRSDSETVELIGVATTPRQAESLADEYAAQFVAHLENEAAEFADESVAAAELRLAQVESSLAEVVDQLFAAAEAGDSDAQELLQQDRQQFASARIQANAELLALRAAGVPVVPIESLAAAQGNSIVISQSRYSTIVDRGATGDNIAVLFGSETEFSEESGALAAVSGSVPSGLLARIGLGALLGLLGGVAIATTAARLDNRVRSKVEVEQLLDLPVLAQIPTLERTRKSRGQVTSYEQPRSRFAEQYRAIGSALTYARRTRQDSSQVVLVTSPGPSEGKTTTVANLGAMLAESGLSVLLVNCDFRRPRLHEITGTGYQPQAVSRTSISGVSLISNIEVGPDAAPAAIIGMQRQVIESARDRYDIVLVDTAPVLATNDAVDLLDLANDVIVVLRAGKSTLHAADRAAEILERRRAHLLGVAMTDVSARHTTDYYYYDGYYEAEPVDSNGKPRAKRFAKKRREVEINLDEESTEALSLLGE